MNKHIFTLLFLLGAAVLAWVGAGFMGSHLLALAVTLVIAAVFAFGALELQRFRQATATLHTALMDIPQGLTDLGNWLGGVHPSLQNPVRLRIEGERTGLPGPALTPYLVGLLVMLGMLGTFLGMVVTLNGAVFALEGTPDLQAIRSAFATPIRGLGLAFGTSVAGVATSALLGLMSALSRRERAVCSQLLDSRIATQLRSFSLTQQRQDAYKALQLQSQTLPLVMDKLHSVMEQMERMGQQMNERLLSNQAHFHSEVKTVYTALASSVDSSLRTSLAHSAQTAGDSLKPVLQEAMRTMAQESRDMHARMVGSTQEQIEQLTTQLHSDAQHRVQAWTSALEGMAAGLQREWQTTAAQTLAQQQAICGTLGQTAQQVTNSTQAQAEKTLVAIQSLLASSEELVHARKAADADWSLAHAQRTEHMAALLRTELAALRDAEAQRGQAAVARLAELQAALTAHLSTLGTALEAPISRLIETASEAPRAAAQVIGQLRQEVSNSVARDNELLEERSRILQTLNTLLEGIRHASTEQRAVIDTLVSASADALEQAGGQFSERVQAEAAKLSDIAANVTSSAVDVSSLSEAFGFAVQSFNAGNEKLVASLQRIEGAMDKSMARSDEQLAYYVAQAREVIDLSIASQKDIVEELRLLSNKQAQLADEAA